MSTDSGHLLLVARSGRMLANSAARMGIPVTVIDGYADADTRRLAARSICVDPTDPTALSRALRDAVASRRFDGLVYGGGMEAVPGFLAAARKHMPVYGNRVEVLKALADPEQRMEVFTDLGIPQPPTRLLPPAGNSGGWLTKLSSGCGGEHVRAWRQDRVVPLGTYWQRHVAGVVRSVLFAANGSDFVLIAFSHLLPTGPGQSFVYRGAIHDPHVDDDIRSQTRSVLSRLVPGLGLRGLNGIDFVVHDDQLKVIDINARPTATLDLYDADFPEGLVALHIRAAQGELPTAIPEPRRVRGHRICYAPAQLRIKRRDWPRWCSDLPVNQSTLGGGAPLCTVHASSPHASRLPHQLRARERRILESLGGSGTGGGRP